MIYILLIIIAPVFLLVYGEYTGKNYIKKLEHINNLLVVKVFKIKALAKKIHSYELKTLKKKKRNSFIILMLLSIGLILSVTKVPLLISIIVSWVILIYFIRYLMFRAHLIEKKNGCFGCGAVMNPFFLGHYIEDEK